MAETGETGRIAKTKKTKQIERIMACRGFHLVAEFRTTGESQRVRLTLEGLFLLGLGRFRLEG